MVQIRRARRDDARVLADLVFAASEGLSEAAWRRLASNGEDPWEIGRRRQAEKTETDDIWVVDEGHGAIAGLTGYPIGPHPEGPDEDTPPLFRPLLELEALAPSTWYVNVLAALPAYRGHGLGTELLKLAEHRALAAGLHGLSLIVADTNTAARRLYERMGYRERARRPMSKEGWDGPGNEWVLMIRDL